MNNTVFPFSRGRRLRANSAIRGMVAENHLNVNDLIAPVFVVEGSGVKEEIPSMQITTATLRSFWLRRQKQFGIWVCNAYCCLRKYQTLKKTIREPKLSTQKA